MSILYPLSKVRIEMNLLGCACGGIIEITTIVLTFFTAGISVWITEIYNKYRRRK